MRREIKLPAAPKFGLVRGELISSRDEVSLPTMTLLLEDYAKEAVETDRRGIVVTDADVYAAIFDATRVRLLEEEASDDDIMRAALEAYAKRLRGLE